MVLLRPLALFTFAASLASVASAKAAFGEACDQANNHLDSDTWTFTSDCDQTTYCDANATCAHRGCRRDTYPVGYSDVAFADLPPLCGEGLFCPDEMDHCLSQNQIGGPCQKDRDDQCAPSSNYKDYASYLNVNGSICLSFTCYWANVTAGQPCIVDNTYYEGTSDSNVTFAYMVSRDNCNSQYFYCDGTELVCMSKKHRGDACSADKECFSFNCQENGTCGKAADEPLKPKAWEYVVIGLAIVILIVGVMVGLWFLHRRWREENQVKLEQYYNEQIAYRQSIMSMSHAKNSLLSLPQGTSPDLARASLYTDESGNGNHAGPSQGFSTARSDALLPPNMRREGSNSFTDDSEVLLMNQHNAPAAGPGARFRGN